MKERSMKPDRASRNLAYEAVVWDYTCNQGQSPTLDEIRELLAGQLFYARDALRSAIIGARGRSDYELPARLAEEVRLLLDQLWDYEHCGKVPPNLNNYNEARPSSAYLVLGAGH